MTDLSRRSMFAMAAGAAVAPIVAKLPLPALPALSDCTIITMSPSMAEIVTTTLRNRSAVLAMSVTRNNAMLRQLKDRGWVRA